jgi:hypothetical protein
MCTNVIKNSTTIIGTSLASLSRVVGKYNYQISNMLIFNSHEIIFHDYVIDDAHCSYTTE